MIRVTLPAQLRILADVHHEIALQVDGPATLGAVLDAIETRYPMLRGTLRDYGSQQRRPFIRFFAGGEDLSDLEPDVALPAAVASGDEPLRVVGAMAGG